MGFEVTTHVEGNEQPVSAVANAVVRLLTTATNDVMTAGLELRGE